MSVSSAEPDKLAAFVESTRPGRVDSEHEQRRVAGLQSSVRAASPDYGVDAAVVSALADRLSSMHDNERFVSTICTELLAADQHGGGLASVADTALRATLEAAGVGTPPPQLTFEPATIYGLPPTSGFVDDPICAANGNMVHQDVDLVFPGVASALDLERTYNSLLVERDGAFGPGWSSVLDVALDAFDGRVEIHLPDGATAAFVRVDDRWLSAGRRLRGLERDGAGWRAAIDDLRSWCFDADGALTGWAVGPAVVEVERREGRIVAVTERVSGRGYTIEWSDADPRVISRIDTSDGRSVTYARDSERRLTRAASAAGHLDYEWDGARLLSVIDADGVRPFRNEYDAAGRVVRQTSPFGRVTDYRYEADGLTVITDEHGARQAMVHDGRGNLTAVIDTDGSAMRLAYDELDRVVQVTDQAGAVWAYRYSDDDRLTERVDPDGLSESWTWDAIGRITSRTDRSGAVTHFQYRGRLRSPVRIVGPGGEITSAEIDDTLDLPVAVADPDGVVTRVEYDRDGQPIAAIDALGGRATFEFDRVGRLVGHCDAAGVATHIDHDAAGRVVAHTRAGATTTYHRTPAGRVCGGNEPGGVAWSARFGPHGAPVAVTDALGATLGFRYDSMGNLSEVIAPDGATVRHEYDHGGRLVAVVDPAGGVARQVYDRAGRVVGHTDAAGRAARREVDVFGRTLRSTAADGSVTRFAYHANGELASVIAPDGRTWMTEIDANGRTAAVISPSGARAELEYTPAGRLAGRRSPARRLVRFEYDAAGRRAAIIDAAGVRHEIERDRNGRLTGAADVEVTWDAAGRLSGYRAQRSAAAFERDAAGRLTAVTDGGGARTEYEWDGRGLLVGATDPAGGRARYRYDAGGRLIAQTMPGERTSTWAYDSHGRVAEAIDPAGVVTRIGRDAAGFVTELSRGGAGWARTLDAAGRELRRSGGGGAVLGEYEYDVAGRLVAAFHPPGWSREFVWDDDDRLTGVVGDDGSTAVTRPDRVRAADTYDPAGRISLGGDGTAYRYDAAGRLAEMAPPDGDTLSFEYGDDGLLAVERKGDCVRRFQYDVAGRVAAVTVDGAATTRFAYDAAGRRVSEISDEGDEVHYCWSGLDRLGEVVRLTPDGRRIAVAIDTDAFGRPWRLGEQPIANDPPTLGSLVFLGARVLDRASHQFLSPDPLLTVPGTNGSASAYTYAWNDPVNFVDPSGLRPISQQDWDAIRKREEQGRIGEAWEAVKDDPWASLAAGTVIAAGAVLCVTPLAPVGVGVLIGAGVSAGTGLATGSLDPRQVALGGVLGGIAGGAGAAGLSAAESMSVGVRVGAVGDLATQVIQGGPIDWGSVAFNGVVGGVAGGIGFRLGQNPATSVGRTALVGAATDGGESVVRQALTGDRTVDLTEVAFDAAGGAGSGVANDYFSARLLPGRDAPTPLALAAGPQRLALPAGAATETVATFRGGGDVVALQIESETGLTLSDIAGRANIDAELVDVSEAGSSWS